MRKEVRVLNVGEKVSLYKDKLKFKNYQEFGKAVGVPGDWINELSKKDEVKFVDMNHLIRLCSYLGITIDQLVKNEETESKNLPATELVNINEKSDDVGSIIDELVLLLNKDNVRLNGLLLNESSKQICKDALEVVKILTKQYL